MNKYFIIITTFILIVIYSCDTIEGDYVEDNAPFISDVVLFEFTGIHCPNCPDAHRVIDGLQEQFGTRFHTISIHSGGFALPWSPDEPDFRTEVGDEIHDRVNSKKEYPSGSVMNLGEGASISTTAWSTELGKFGWSRADVEIELTTEIDGTVLKADVTSVFENDVEGAYKLCLFVVEDEVSGFQQDGGDAIEDYIHKHVLRGSMNGAWGSSVETSLVNNKKFTMDLSSDWNAEKLHVIPFVYNVETMKVLPSNINEVE